MASATTNSTYGQCRCCLTLGYHSDIMMEHYYNGTREVYYDSFMECFNLYLSTNGKLSKLICKSCIDRLHDASSFRATVLETERILLDAVGDQETIFVNVSDHLFTREEDIKLEEPAVKSEPSDAELDAEPCGDDSDGGDEPLAKLKARSELVEGERELLERCKLLKPLPTRQDLHSLYPAFAKHLDMLRGKYITAEMISKQLDETYRTKLTTSRRVLMTEKMAQIENAATLLENSNLTPFKSKNRTGFPCFYCRHIFETLDRLREHQKGHRKSELRKLLATYGAECLVVYVDTTDLKCAVCNTNIPTINELKSHLTKTHKKVYHHEFTDRIIPFKLSEDNIFVCQICGFSFETFGSIERHMNVHYRNYVCKECGTGFVTKYRLKVHIKSMHMSGNHLCDVCKKVYSTTQKLKNHIDTVHRSVKRFKCPKCSERFTEYFTRQKHLVSVHGVAPLLYKCNVCDKSFDRRYTLSRHMKRDHLEERDFQCEHCSYKCFTNNELRVHMIKHNGERIFECAVCKKAYARKKTLKEHMRIHNNDRRFACPVCGQAFVQKCSLKGHMKTHHMEYTLQ